MSLAVYIIGAPGAGKSTLLRTTLEAIGQTGRHEVDLPIPHVVVEGTDWVEVGRDSELFSGTDRLSYTVASRAIEWVTSTTRPELLVAEGDRLSSPAFLNALIEGYDRFRLVSLTNREVAHRRMLDRAAATGRRPQNDAWWRGRATKCARLTVEFDEWAVKLDAALPLDVKVRALVEVMAEIP